MEKKYQVFISSTYTDLRDERDKVRDAILSLYHFPVGMELFGAADEEQWDIIKETIDTSDYYILLIGQRYGTIITDGPDAGISYTEKEFRYAREKGIPILAFQIEDNVLVKPDNIEREHKKEFEAFKEMVRTGRTIDRWSNPDDLAQKVTASLIKQIRRNPRPGWIRGGSIPIEKSQDEIAEFNKEKRGEKTLRKPVLKLGIKNYGTRERPNNAGEELIVLKLNDIERDGYFHVPDKLTLNDIAGLEGVSSYDITEYNNKLPQREDISKYNEAVYVFRMMIENGYHLKCRIQNDGTSKAAKVIAKISFPDELIAINWREVQELDPPSKPKLPINPIEAKTKPKTINDLKYSLANFMKDKVEYYGEGKYKVHQKTIFSGFNENNVTHGTHLEDNTVVISANDLLHKSEILTSDFCIIPKAKGTFTVTISLMCEEFIEPDIYEMRIIVE